MSTPPGELSPSAGRAEPALLSGVRIVDCSASLAAAFCASLLQRLGAQVTRVDSASWPAERKTTFADEYLSESPTYREYLHRGKEVVQLDLLSAEGKDAMKQMLTDSDVLVEDWRTEALEAAGLGRATLSREYPALIVASVTPYGRRGRRSEWPASDLTVYHGGGPGFGTPGLVDDPETRPPLRLGSHQGLFASGMAAAINVCAAILLRTRQPASGSIRIDFSCFEAMANCFRQSLGTFAFYGGGLSRDLARGRGAGGTADIRNIRCRDGWINLSWAGVKQWHSLKELLGHPSWMEDDRLESPALRYRNWTLVQPHLDEWASTQDKEQLFYICQGYRVPCAPVNDGPDLLSADLFISRGFWTDGSYEGRRVSLPDLRSQFSGGAE